MFSSAPQCRGALPRSARTPGPSAGIPRGLPQPRSPLARPTFGAAILRPSPIAPCLLGNPAIARVRNPSASMDSSIHLTRCQQGDIFVSDKNVLGQMHTPCSPVGRAARDRKTRGPSTFRLPASPPPSVPTGASAMTAPPQSARGGTSTCCTHPVGRDLAQENFLLAQMCFL